MKTLTILRHAKAERPEAYSSDFERPLTERGHKDAERMAAMLERLEPAIDLIVSSPAARAAQTASHVANRLHLKQPVSWNEAIYLATPNALIEILRETAEEFEHVVLVGHNPTLTELTTGLCGGTPDDSSMDLPTAGLAHLSLAISRWSLLRWGSGQLKLLIGPRSLK